MAGRVSQAGVEVFYADDLAKACVSQAGVEVFYTWAAADPTTVTGAGVSQAGVEVFYADDLAKACVSQAGVEVFYTDETVIDASSGVRVYGYAS